MQKRLLTIAFAGLLSASSAFAGDLLSQATDGAVVKTTEAKALSSSEMSDVKGGASTLYSGIYASAFNYPAQNRAMSTLATNLRVKTPGRL